MIMINIKINIINIIKYNLFDEYGIGVYDEGE